MCLPPGSALLYMFTVWFPDTAIERLLNLREGTFPGPSHPLSDSARPFTCFVSDQLQELRTRKLGDSSRKRVIALIQLVTQTTPGK